MTTKIRPVAILLLLLPYAYSQPASMVRPQIEVASIKLNNACGNRREGSGPATPGRMIMICWSVRDMIQTAYGRCANGVNPSAKRLFVVNAPEWTDTDLYDIEAKAEGAIPPGQMYGPMLQALLEDRFKLKMHIETRELPAYALVAPKGTSKLAGRKNEDCVVMDVNHLPQPAPGQAFPKFCGRQTTDTQNGNLVLSAYGMSMREFCDGPLSARLDRPVVDRTDVSGRFDLQIKFAPNVVSRLDAPAPDVSGPSIFTAIQEQIGLKLEATKAPIEVRVVDHVEKPTAN